MRIMDLIWDFDGTLFDTYPPMCTDLKNTMAALGHQFTEEELLEQFTQSRGKVLAYCAGRTGLTAEQVDGHYRAYVAEHGHPEAHPFPYVVEFLAKFQAAGGRNFVFTPRSESVHDYLAEAGLTRYFTDVVSAGKVCARKPAPDGNLHIITTHGCDKSRVMAVGDRELDILAAKNAGIEACLYTQKKVDSAADYQIADFTELDALVGLTD